MHMNNYSPKQLSRAVHTRADLYNNLLYAAQMGSIRTKEVSFETHTTIIDRGSLKDPLGLKYTYAPVPLGIILSGEIVVHQFGKTVRRLLPGDCVGLFETAYAIKTKHNTILGNWTLVAAQHTEILFFSDDILSNKKLFFIREKIISSAILDTVPNKFTGMPLLDSLAHKINIPYIQNGIVIAHTHLLPSMLPLFEHLAQLVGHQQVFVMDKHYSTIENVYEKLVRMGITVVRMQTQENESHHSNFEKSRSLLWHKVLEAVPLEYTNKIKLIILDDGGDIALSIPWNDLPKNIDIYCVQQTQRGITRIRNTGKKVPPSVSVGSSFIKKNIESDFIAEAIIKKMQSLNILTSQSRIGIIGTGAIGKALYRRLEKQKYTLFCHDTKLEKLSHIPKKSVCHSILELCEKSDIIIGCTGTDMWRGVILEHMHGKKICISASSSDIEFYSLLYGYNTKRTSSYGIVTSQPEPGLIFSIYNAGYPINFDRTQEWESALDMQLTRSLLYLGIWQSVFMGNTSRIQDLDIQKQKETLEEWFTLIKDKKASEEIKNFRERSTRFMNLE